MIGAADPYKQFDFRSGSAIELLDPDFPFHYHIYLL